MSRPIKSGLDYFPLDVHMDEKMELIEAKYGLEGFGLIIKLYQEIYKNSYYYKVTDERLLLLKKRLNIELDFIKSVIDDACRWNLFDQQTFKKRSVLTSVGVQRRFFEATQRRKHVEFIKEYLLVAEPADFYNSAVNVTINSINVNINSVNGNKNSYSGGINVNINTQSKVKERKEAIYSRVIGYLNKKTHSNFKATTKKTISLIKARLNEDFKADDFKKVIDYCCHTWMNDSKMQAYLRPETLFSGKFEGYLNASNRSNIANPTIKPETTEDLNQELKEALA